MIAFAIVLRPLVIVVFQRFDGGDHLVGIKTAGGLRSHQQRLHATIAEGTVVRRNLAAMQLAETIVERLRGRDLVLDPPVVRRTADDAVERLGTRGNTPGVQQDRSYDLHRLLHPEIGRLLQRDLLVPTKIADAEHIRLERLDSRQQRREIGGAERMADIDQALDPKSLAGFLEAAHHLVAISIIGSQERDLLAEFREGIAADRASGEVRIERLMESVFAEIRSFIDGIGLADRIEDDPPFLGHVVDRKLNRGRQAADDEAYLFLFDQFQGPGGGLAGIELVVTHQQFGLAAVQATAFVELGNGDFGRTHLILRFGAIGASQRHRKADLDGRLLRLREVDAEQRGGQNRACARRRQQPSTRNQPGRLSHVFLHKRSLFSLVLAVIRYVRAQ